MKFISSVIVLALGLIGLTSFAMSFKGSSIHPSDVFFMGMFGVFAVMLALHAFRVIRCAFTASIAISMLITVLGILYVFNPSSPDGSLFTTVGVVFATWMMTITKILPTIVSLVAAGVMALVARSNKI